MTLITGIRSADAVVLCADSQETHGGFRTSVEKIVPQRVGRYNVAFAASGCAGLVDALDGLIPQSLRRADLRSEEDAKQWLAKLLRRFYRTQVSIVPGCDDDKRLAGLVCLQQDGHPAWLLSFTDTSARIVQGVDVVGWYSSEHKALAQRLYQDDLPTQRAVLLALNVMSKAKAQTTYVGGPLRVVVASAKGMWVDHQDDIDLLERSVSETEKVLDQLRLACQDPSVSEQAFQAAAAAYFAQLVALRRSHSQALAELDVNRWSNPQRLAFGHAGDPYPKFPEGSSILVWGAEIGGRVSVVQPQDIGEPPTSATTPPVPPATTRGRSRRKPSLG